MARMRRSRRATATPLVVVAPSDARGGTNALLISPPSLIEPSFGESSLAAHLLAASGADATVQLVIDPALGFDLDTPDDLERLDTVPCLPSRSAVNRCLPPQTATTLAANDMPTITVVPLPPLPEIKAGRRPRRRSSPRRGGSSRPPTTILRRAATTSWS